MILFSHVYSRLALGALPSSIRQMEPIHGLQFFFTVAVWLTSPKRIDTVFALLDAAATIYFARQFGAASIGERLLIESGVY